MTGPGAGSRRLCVGSPRRIQTLIRPLAESAGQMLWGCDAQLGTSVGARFCLQTSPLGESCALRSPGPGRCCAPPPSGEKLVRAVR